MFADIRQNTIPGLRQVMARFSLPMAAIFLWAVTCVLWVHSHPMFFGGFRVRLDSQSKDLLLLLAAALYCCKLAFLAHALFFEQRPKQKKREAALSAILILIAIFALFLTANSPWLHVLFLVPGLIFLVMTAGFIGKNYDDLTYCYYNCGLLKAVLYGLLGGFIVSAGLSGAFAGIAYLFELRVRPLYADLWVLGFVLGSYWILARIPRVSDTIADIAFYPRGAATLVSYVLAPLVLFYLVILYLYAIKITVTWELPRGGVGYMVMACGLLGVLTHFLAYPIREHSTRMVRLLHRWFYPALIVPVALLWIAVIQRIADYGITEDRYLVLIIASLLSMASVYGIVRRYVPLRGISLSAALLLIFASFGPWGAVHVSERSQMAELRDILEAQSILVNGKIVTGKGKKTILQRHVAPEVLRRIQNILRYLDHTGKLDALAPWFPEGSTVPGLLYQKKLSGWQMTEEMGLVGPAQHHAGPQSTRFNLARSIAYGEPNAHSFIHTRGFDYLAKIDSFRRASQHGLTAGDKHVSLSIEKDILVVRDNVGHEARFDVADNIPALIARYSRPHMQWRTEIPTHEPALNLLVTSADFTAYLMITQMQGNTAWEEGERVTQLGGYLLLRYGPPLSEKELKHIYPQEKDSNPKLQPASSPGILSAARQTFYPQSIYMAKRVQAMSPTSAVSPQENPERFANEWKSLSSITKPTGVDHATTPKTEPFDVSIPAHLAHEKKFVGKTHRKKGEFVRFGAWDYGDCFNNDQWVCGELNAGGIGCEAAFPQCASGKAVAVESYPGNKQCVVRWWKWVCK